MFFLSFNLVVLSAWENAERSGAENLTASLRPVSV